MISLSPETTASHTTGDKPLSPVITHTKRAVEVNAALIRFERMLHRLVGDEIGVELELNAGPSFVDLHPEAFDRVIAGLALREREAMLGGGLLRIRTEDGTHGLVEIEVRDTSGGMSMETLEGIFDDRATTHSEGTGAGLAVAFGIVRSVGGTIVCETRFGHGSSFRVLLPAANRAEDPRTASIPVVQPRHRTPA